MNEKRKLDEVFIDELLHHVIGAGYSELHLDVGRPPVMTGQTSNDMVEMTQYEALHSALIERMIYDLLTDEQMKEFNAETSLIFTYEAQQLARFGVFIARDPQGILATFHVLPVAKGDIP